MFRKRHDPIKDDEFKQLFDTYKNRLYGYVLAIAHSKYVAEEITQEIFIKLWLCRDILHEVDNLEGYIFTIARNKTLNHLRKAAHNVKLLHELQDHVFVNRIMGREFHGQFRHVLAEECHPGGAVRLFQVAAGG